MSLTTRPVKVTVLIYHIRALFLANFPTPEISRNPWRKPRVVVARLAQVMLIQGW